MQLQTKELEIDGLHFKIVQLPGWKALETSHRLTKALAPALGALGDAAGSEGASGSLADAAQKLFQGLPFAELEGLAKALLEQSTVTDETGKESLVMARATFDRVMAGRVELLFILLFEAARLNYQGFFDRARGRLGGVLSALTSGSLQTSKPSGPATA